jgi:hypothetical protein
MRDQTNGATYVKVFQFCTEKLNFDQIWEVIQLGSWLPPLLPRNLHQVFVKNTLESSCPRLLTNIIMISYSILLVHCRYSQQVDQIINFQCAILLSMAN